MWEDEYDPTNSKFPCAVDRTTGTLPPDQQLNLINHNLNTNFFPFGRGLRIPDRLDSPRTNGVHSYVEGFFSLDTAGVTFLLMGYVFSIMAHADHCSVLTGDRWPNFVLVDFVNVGQAVKAVAQLNGFPY